MHNLYVCQSSDKTWYPVIAPDTPAGGAFVTMVGTYPVELYYVRLDLNGSREVKMEIIENEDQLLSSLAADGLCYHRILALWDFHDSKHTSPKASQMFWEAEEESLRQLREEFEEVFNAPMSRFPWVNRLRVIMADIQEFLWNLWPRRCGGYDEDLPF